MGAADTELLDQTLLPAPPSPPWPLLASLPVQLAADVSPRAWRELLRRAHEELKQRFLAEEPVEALVHARAALIDAVLGEAWRLHCAPHTAWALAAVGGYGRGELHPASDIDILLLVPHSPDAAGGAAVEQLVTFLWDIGLEVGHSVRTVAECREECIRLFVLRFILRFRQSGKGEPLTVNEFAVENVRQLVDDTHVGA